MQPAQLDHPQQNAETPDAIFGDLAPFFPLRHRLNKIQRQVAPTLLNKDHSVVIAAPTGSGKTLLLECAIARLFRSRLVRNLHNNIINSNKPNQQEDRVRAVYLCPMKALAHERYTDWASRFAPHGVRVAIETGDQSQVSESTTTAAQSAALKNNDALEEVRPDVLDADLIVSTPERWDAITRRWTHHTMLAFVASVRLLLIDEVHVLDEPRGAVLEVIVSRMRTVHREVGVNGPRVRAAMTMMNNNNMHQQQLHHQDAEEATTNTNAATPQPPSDRIRFIAASGTVSNPQDIAAWLECPPAHSGGCFRFSEADRPVPLAVHVVGVGHGGGGGGGNPFALEKTMTARIPHLICTHSDGKPTLIFCCSRREVATTAEQLASEAMAPTDAVIAQRLAEAAGTVADATLKRALPKRVAIHHAALSLNDRRTVESLFLSQTVLVLCTTTTLSVGVNLPARLVIVKGTVSFAGTGNSATTGGTAATAKAAASNAGGGAMSNICDLGLSDVAQMCGRAGRAGFDDQGVAVVLTAQEKVRYYDVLQSGRQPPPVESQLHLNMIAHVNAELVLGTITSPSTAAAWLETTYLWVRLQRNPDHYWSLLTTTTTAKQQQQNQQQKSAVFAAELARSIIARLIAADCCAAPTLPIVRRNGGQRNYTGRLMKSEEQIFEELSSAAGCNSSNSNHTTTEIPLVPTTAGQIFARFYLDFDTITAFSQVIGWPAALAAAHENNYNSSNDDNINEDDADDETELFPCSIRTVLTAICHANEFNECCRLRQGDRSVLNDINKNSVKVRFPLHDGNNKGGREVRETWQKVFVLIQYRLHQQQQQQNQNQHQNPAEQQQQHQLTASLNNDAARLWQVLPRLAHAMVEIAELTQHSQFLVSAWRLRKCIDRGFWWDAPRLTRQLPGVGDAISRALLDKGGYSSIGDLLAPDVDPRRLESLCGRNPPFGSTLLRACHSIPRFRLSISTVTNNSKNENNNNSTTASLPTRCTVSLTPIAAAGASSSTTTGNRDHISRFLLIVAECRSRCRVLFTRRLRFNGDSWRNVNNTDSGNSTFTFELPASTAEACAAAVRRSRLVERRKREFEQQLLLIGNKKTRAALQKKQKQQLQEQQQSAAAMNSGDAPFLRAWLIHETLLGCDSAVAAAPNVLFGGLFGGTAATMTSNNSNNNDIADEDSAIAAMTDTEKNQQQPIDVDDEAEDENENNDDVEVENDRNDDDEVSEKNKNEQDQAPPPPASIAPPPTTQQLPQPPAKPAVAAAVAVIPPSNSTAGTVATTIPKPEDPRRRATLFMSKFLQQQQGKQQQQPEKKLNESDAANIDSSFSSSAGAAAAVSSSASVFQQRQQEQQPHKTTSSLPRVRGRESPDPVAPAAATMMQQQNQHQQQPTPAEIALGASTAKFDAMLSRHRFDPVKAAKEQQEARNRQQSSAATRVIAASAAAVRNTAPLLATPIQHQQQQQRRNSNNHKVAPSFIEIVDDDEDDNFQTQNSNTSNNRIQNQQPQPAPQLNMNDDDDNDPFSFIGFEPQQQMQHQQPMGMYFSQQNPQHQHFYPQHQNNAMFFSPAAAPSNYFEVPMMQQHSMNNFMPMQPNHHFHHQFAPPMFAQQQPQQHQPPQADYFHQMYQNHFAQQQQQHHFHPAQPHPQQTPTMMMLRQNAPAAASGVGGPSLSSVSARLAANSSGNINAAAATPHVRGNTQQQQQQQQGSNGTGSLRAYNLFR